MFEIEVLHRTDVDFFLRDSKMWFSRRRLHFLTLMITAYCISVTTRRRESSADHTLYTASEILTLLILMLLATDYSIMFYRVFISVGSEPVKSLQTLTEISS